MDRKSSWCSFIPYEFLSMIANDGKISPDIRESVMGTIEEGKALSYKVGDLKIFHSDESHEHLRRIVYDGGGFSSVPSLTSEPGSDSPLCISLGCIFDFFRAEFGHKIFEGDKRFTIAVVNNYGRDYMNAHWKGSEVVLGSGNWDLWGDFENAEDIIAYEITHGIIMRTSRLMNTGETGALNEHLSDVFGLLHKQQLSQGLNMSNARDYTWTIGEKLWTDPEHIFTRVDEVDDEDDSQMPDLELPGLKPFRKRHLNGNHMPAVEIADLEPFRKRHAIFDQLPQYLRSFADPGSTKPPQPMHYDDYRNLAYDNGGVHSNSGIANYAFYTAAIAAGGAPWQGVGQVWFRAMTDPSLGADCKFARFAAFTMAYANGNYSDLAEPIKKGWEMVGVIPSYN